MKVFVYRALFENKPEVKWYECLKQNKQSKAQEIANLLWLVQQDLAVMSNDYLASSSLTEHSYIAVYWQATANLEDKIMIVEQKVLIHVMNDDEWKTRKNRETSAFCVM